jgi:hypothetical protein
VYGGGSERSSPLVGLKEPLNHYKITLQRPKGLLFDPLIWTIICPLRNGHVVWWEYVSKVNL